MLRKRTTRLLSLAAGATLALSAFAGAAGAFESGRLVPELEPPVVDVQPPLTHLDINPCILLPQGCPPPTTTAPPPVKDPCRQRTAATLSRRCPPPTTTPPVTTPPVTTPPVTTPPDTTPPATTPPEVIHTASIPVPVAAAPTFTG